MDETQIGKEIPSCWLNGTFDTAKSRAYLGPMQKDSIKCLLLSFHLRLVAEECVHIETKRLPKLILFKFDNNVMEIEPQTRRGVPASLSQRHVMPDRRGSNCARACQALDTAMKWVKQRVFARFDEMFHHRSLALAQTLFASYGSEISVQVR